MADIFNNTGCNSTEERNCTGCNSMEERNCTNFSTVSPGATPTKAFAFETSIVIGMLVLYVIALIFALLGNLFGIYVAIKRSSKKKNMMHWMIANLASADLIVALTSMPCYFRYLFVSSKWYGGIVGEVSCKLIHYLFHISLSASILTILIISLDRFAAIVLPLKFRLLNRPKTMAGIIWVCSFGIMSVIAMVYTLRLSQTGFYHCEAWWNNWEETSRIMKMFYLVVFVILYALPLTLICLMYAIVCIKLWLRKIPGNFSDTNQRAVEKSRRKVIRMLMVIVVVFAVTWFPAHVMHYYMYYRLEDFNRIPMFWRLFFFWLCQANSAINPILYVLMNDSFREELYYLFYKLKTCAPCKNFSQNARSRFLRSRSSPTLGANVFTNFTSFGKSKKYSMRSSPKQNRNEEMNNAVFTEKIEVAAETPRQKENKL